MGHLASACPDFAGLLWHADSGERITPDGHDPAACPACSAKLREWDGMRRALHGLRGVLEADGGLPAPDAEDHAAAAATLARLAAHAGPGSRIAELRALIAEARAAQSSDRIAALRISERALALARELNSDARREVSRLGDALLASAQAGHGFALARVGRVPEAIEELRRAVGRWRALGDPLGLAGALSNLGYAHSQAREVDAAEKAIREALRMFISLDVPLEVAGLRLNLAIILGDAQRFADAVVEAMRSAAEFAALGRPADRARALQCAAWNKPEAGDPEGAVPLAREAGEILRAAGDPVDAANCEWAVARACSMKTPGSAEASRAFAAAHSVFAATGLWLEAVCLRCDWLKDAVRAGDQERARRELAALSTERPADLRNAWIDQALADVHAEFERASWSRAIARVDELVHRLQQTASAASIN